MQKKPPKTSKQSPLVTVLTPHFTIVGNNYSSLLFFIQRNPLIHLFSLIYKGRKRHFSFFFNFYM